MVLSERSDDIVITGVGLVTCLGLDHATTWRAVAEGRCGIGPLSAVESTLDPDKGGGQVDDPHDLGGGDAREEGAASLREVRLLRRALREAMQDAGIDGRLPCESHRCSVLLGTTLHGMRNGGAFLRAADYNPLRAFLAGAVLGAALEGFPGAGLAATNSSPCSSGLASVSLGHTMLQAGEADLVIAGGYEPISEYSYAGFNSMRLVSSTTLRPFAKTRDGMKVAEGYAIVVLERLADAERRQAEPLARIAGYGESSDAYHLSKPHPEGAGAAVAMRQALASAELEPCDIDMLIAHATATPDNDRSEHAAMAQVFGDRLRNIPVVGLKSHLGHSLGAAGTVDLILAASAIRDGVVPVCANTDPAEVEFADIRLGAMGNGKQELRHVLNTSLGFGGANVCMVVAKPRKRSGAPAVHATIRSLAARDVVITGVGVMLPGAIGSEAFSELVSDGGTISRESLEAPIPMDQCERFLNARRTRRMSVCVKLCLAATTDAYRDAGIEDVSLFGEHCSAIIGTTHGAVEFCETYYRQIVEEGVDAANPILFAEGVPNIASAHLATSFSLKGFCQTMIGTRTAGLEALQLATARIRTGVWERAVVGATDEHADAVCRAYRELRPDPEFIYAGGAATFILESRSVAEARGARIRGVIDGCASCSYAGCSGFEKTWRIADVIGRLGPLYTLARCTEAPFVDRIEQLGIRAALRKHPRPKGDTPPILPELFSAGPLAALSVFLLTGGTSLAPRNSQRADRRIGVVCSDDNATTCGAVVTLP